MDKLCFLKTLRIIIAKRTVEKRSYKSISMACGKLIRNLLCVLNKKTKKIPTSYTYLPSGFNFVLKVGDLAITTKK